MKRFYHERMIKYSRKSELGDLFHRQRAVITDGVMKCSSGGAGIIIGVTVTHSGILDKCNAHREMACEKIVLNKWR